jgi:hypothetical protein
LKGQCGRALAFLASAGGADGLERPVKQFIEN